MHHQYTFKQFFYRYSYLLIVAAWLISISFIVDNYWGGNSSLKLVNKALTADIRNKENDFEKIAIESNLTNKIIAEKYDEVLLNKITAKPYFLYLFSQNVLNEYQLIFWNTQTIMPSTQILNDTAKSGFAELANGFYIWRKAIKSNCTMVALIPIKWNYAITNDYLKNKFAIVDNIDNNYDIATKIDTINSIKSKEGVPLFSLEQKGGILIYDDNMATIISRIIAAFIVLLFIHFMAFYFVRNYFFTTIISLIFIVVLLRVLSYYFQIPLNFRQFELFDPAIYGSSNILKSLGDLLINSLLFLWVTLFIRSYIEVQNVAPLSIQRQFLRWLSIFGLILLLIINTFVCGNVFRSLVADSQISFDVINFFSLNYFSVAGFIVLGTISIAYFFTTQIILNWLYQLLGVQKMQLSFLIAITGLVILTCLINTGSMGFELVLLLWLILFLQLIGSDYLTLLASKLISSRLVFWILFFSISITLIIIEENNQKEIEKRKRYAETLSNKADPSSERLMNTVLADFRSETLAPLFDGLKKAATNKKIKDSLLNENFTGYLNKYDTRIYTFNENERPLFNQDSISFGNLISIYKTQAKPTGVADLFYYDLSYDRFTYIAKKDIFDTADKILGYVFILASPKKYKTDALYPELFLKGYNNAIENSSIYSYAVYNKLHLVNSHNDYPFSWKLDSAIIPKVEYQIIYKNDYDELWYRNGIDKVVIIVKKKNVFLEAITLFSYLFCSFLLVSAIFGLLNALIRSRFSATFFKQFWQIKIRTQIHGTIIFISLFSFIIIGVTTILFFINRYNTNNREKLSRTIQVMDAEVKNSLAQLSIFDDGIKIYDSAHRASLESSLNKISEIHAADINLYDLDGNLQVSSLPMPYSKGIVSAKMNPLAYYHLHHLKEIQYFNEEQIGSLNYLSNYVPVIDELGKEYAYINIPYYTSQTKLRQEISNFLVTIINLNAFIFLIAGIVALFITNRITQSFSFISDKMKEVNIGKKNEAIVWNRNDEIGDLVNEYNKMVTKLDNSAIALAKSEREGAWREMAKQVAHEIKNPLTPMKLSLQYLQKAIDANSKNVRELSNSVAKTLVEQIDHLSQIASDFSQFANIGNPKNALFDLNKILTSVTQLHSIEDELDLQWNFTSFPVMINADSTHINRLFNNLVQNALQAIPNGTKPIISITETVIEGKVLVTIKDNGCGIPIEMQPKIFTPNFTTKTSGTGLGLAMCKSIVEQSKGRIWFKTNEQVGTMFFVELPIFSSVDEGLQTL